MILYKNCQMDTLRYDGTADNEPCQVRIDNDTIVVTYEEEPGLFISYKGKANGAGHYELLASDVNGRATLHRFAGGNFLEGYWIEGGGKGMWRIMLQK